ncbi:MAG: Tetraacyldisaccharide 4'-kinase [Gemmatimonadaceae bacterium]|nr:Tetraacyldisaccharide 4'-kinase [Gemmatimonadaceae bacterium]
MNVVDRLWFSDSVGARLSRVALHPLELSYRGIVVLRNRMYDWGMLAVMPAPVPAISVGNLTVGGTGKTPVAAYFAQRLMAMGAKPAIVLRGYGDDEASVHAELNPGVDVIVQPDRVQGARQARAAGADVVVMDDAFQHRRAGRLLDVVLISAERFTVSPRLLPSGPWREGLSALRRASMVIVTRKSSSAARAEDVAHVVAGIAGVPVATAALEPAELIRRFDRSTQPISALADRRVLLVAAVGNPWALASQLQQAGLRVELRAFRDHYAYSAGDIPGLVRDASTADAVVCTLKDVVKLDRLWPRSAPPLWYVSQRIVPEQNAEHLDSALARVVSART